MVRVDPGPERDVERPPEIEAREEALAIMRQLVQRCAVGVNPWRQ
jgi:hypothetical protein